VGPCNAKLANTGRVSIVGKRHTAPRRVNKPSAGWSTWRRWKTQPGRKHPNTATKNGEKLTLNLQVYGTVYLILTSLGFSRFLFQGWRTTLGLALRAKVPFNAILVRS
jgi:hypothetical protein